MTVLAFAMHSTFREDTWFNLSQDARIMLCFWDIISVITEGKAVFSVETGDNDVNGLPLEILKEDMANHFDKLIDY